jgi:hypothetical protein
MWKALLYPLDNLIPRIVPLEEESPWPEQVTWFTEN